MIDLSLLINIANFYALPFWGSLDPESAEAFSNPTLPVLAQLFSQEPVMLTGWIHFIVLDLFTGRYVYLEGREKGIFTIHSLILCFFAGPIGLLSHIVTSWIQLKVSKPEEIEASAT